MPQHDWQNRHRRASELAIMVCQSTDREETIDLLTRAIAAGEEAIGAATNSRETTFSRALLLGLRTIRRYDVGEPDE